MLPQGVIGLVLLILLVLGAVWLLQALTTSNHSPQQTDLIRKSAGDGRG